MKYIGHLDLLKIFQAAIRRAKIPIAYSKGFNPHERISFALPLPVGMESVCELCEIIVDNSYAKDMINALNAQLPQGLEITAVYEPLPGSPRIAALVFAAYYSLGFPNMDNCGKYVSEILSTDELNVVKKSKSSEREVNIRKDIISLEYKETLLMRLSAGSAGHLSPLLIADILFNKMRIAVEPYQTRVTRLEIYKNDLSPIYGL